MMTMMTMMEMKRMCGAVVAVAVLLLVVAPSSLAGVASVEDPIPPTWPEKLHMQFVTTRHDNLSLDTLYYDYHRQRNFILIQHQQAVPDIFDLETESGDTFYYNPDLKTCKVIHMPVGVLRPDWLKGAKFAGERIIHNIRCNCWNQTWDEDPTHDLTYCAQVKTDRPVWWRFGIDGATQDVIVYEPNVSPPDPSVWKVPPYCPRNSTRIRRLHNSESAASSAQPAEPTPRTSILSVARQLSSKHPLA